MRKILIFLFLIVASSTLCAQRCYSEKATMGARLFGQGKYSEARALFVEAKSCPDRPKSGREMEAWIKKCDEKLTVSPQTASPETPKQSSPTKKTSKQSSPSPKMESGTLGPREVETNLSVYPTELSFSRWGGTQTINVSCNSDWEVSSSPANWGHLDYTRNGNKISIKIDEYNSVGQRKDFFVIKSGNKKCTINRSETEIR